MKIKVVIVDDHPVFRDGMKGLLNSVSDMEVVGQASTGEEAVRVALDTQPQVVLMDIKMPCTNGIQATNEIRKNNPQIKILMMTMHEGEESIFASMRAGANGYLLKGASQEEILRAIRAAANGEIIFGPDIARSMMKWFSNQNPITSNNIFPELTRREHEILLLITQGYSNSEISDHLQLTIKTIQNHVSNILNKLHVEDRVKAVLRAKEAGFGNIQ